jgi:hypothetical protein
VQVPDLKVERNDLVIATHGRSFYVLDNIAPLRQWTDRPTEGAVHLFKPEGVYRGVHNANIDLFTTAPFARIDIDILDAAGTVVRRLDTPDALPAGHHRWQWNLRTKGATVFPGIVLEAPTPAAGVLVPPGEYTVRMRSGDMTRTQRFTVRPDPRLIEVTAADYAAQYALSLKLRDAVSRANDAVLWIRAEKSRAGASQPRVEALAAIEADLYQVRHQSPKDKIAFPIRLNDRLAGLLAIVQAGDGAPTVAQRQVADQLIAELTAHLARLEKIR